MTTMFNETIECAVCGTQNEILALGSTNAFGSPDLDLRPPEMQRSTMDHWVYECSGCGYAAADLSEVSNTTRDAVLTSSYTTPGEFKSAPALATRFLKAAHWAEIDTLRAISLLHAAWVFDDAKQAENATSARVLASSHLKACLPGIEVERRPTEQARLIDILRRSGNFQMAIAEADALLNATDTDETIHCIAAFQREKCLSQDIASYTVSTALPKE